MSISTSLEITAEAAPTGAGLASAAGSVTLPGRGEHRAAMLTRRVIDLAVAGLLVVVLAPLLLALTLAIRLESPGPALFRQRRIGRGLNGFRVHKFRSMREDANPERHRQYVQALIGGHNRPVERDGTGPSLYKLAVDDRITGIGRLLRHWSLDELPQLFDVLRGDMSLVGPRPVIPYEVERYPAEWLERFAVKPGLTGLWQVSGRSERTYEEMVLLDIEYARNRTLLTDLRILLRTPAVVLLRRGAA